MPMIQPIRRWSFAAAPAWRPASDVALLAAAAVATAFLLHAVIAASRFDALSADAGGLGPLWAAVMVAIALAAHAAQRARWNATLSRSAIAVLAGAAAALVMAPLMAGLHGTDQPLYTVLRGDMTFRTEYVTRFATTWHLQDYTLRGLRAFYPPAWFWLAGRTAHALGIAPWRIVKPFSIGTMGVALLASYGLWRMVVSPAAALSAAIGSSLVLTPQVGNLTYSTQAWYSPYSCFVAVTGVAWLAATLHTIRRDGGRLRLAALAVVGALLALCYYLLFLILALTLAALVLGRRTRRSHAVRRAAFCLGGIAVLTAVFWIPLLAGVLHGSAAQGHYVRPDFLKVNIGLGGPTGLTILTVVSVGALAATISGHASRAVAGLLVGIVLYQIASVTTLVLAHNQLQPHRAVTMLWATLGAAVPATLDTLPLRVPRSLLGGVMAVAVAATFILGANEGRDLAAGPLTRIAHREPDFVRAHAISRFITTSTGRPPNRLTLLTADERLLVIEPYYGFLPLRARYAHPEARIPRRIAALRTVAGCPTPRCALRALGHTPFGRVDALVLQRLHGAFTVEGQEDGFPEPIHVLLIFRRRLLFNSLWLHRRFGAYMVFVRRQDLAAPNANERIASLKADATVVSRTRTTRDGSFWRRLSSTPIRAPLSAGRTMMSRP